MRKVFGFTVVLVALFAASAAAQDAVEIKEGKPKVGEKAKVTVEEKTESKLVINVGGNEMVKNEKKGKSLVYVDKVLAVADGARKPTKLERTYEKAVTSNEGKNTTLPVEGKTVLIEKKGEKYTYTIDGKAVTGEAATLLDGEFNKTDKDDPRDLMMPKKPVKPGDTWKIDGDAFAKGLGEKDFKLDKDKIVAVGKLVKAYKTDGKQFGVLEMKITAPITDLGAKAMLKVKEGSLSVLLTGDGCIDGTSPQGKSNAVMKFTIGGTGEGFELKVEVTMTEARTTEPVK